MEKKLVVLSPYKGFELQLNEIFDELNIHPLLIEGQDISNSLIDELNGLFKGDLYPYVIISRGAVASYINNMFKNTIVLRIEPDYFDIIDAINSAKIYGNRIGILSHLDTAKAMKEKVENIKKILNLEELRVFTFETISDIQNQIICGNSEGMDVMVGGGTGALEYGVLHNIPVVFVKSSKDSVIQAINQAISIINIREKEKKELENLKLVVDCISEAVMAIKDNKVILINSKLEDMLGIKSAEVFNKQNKKINDTIAEFINKSNKNKEIIVFGGLNFLVEKSDIGESSFIDTVLHFHNVKKIQEQEQKIRSKLHAKGFVAKYSFNDIKGRNEAIQDVIKKARIYASTDACILILGNTGTGKELLAQSIHNESTRKNNPFVPINCGAIPESLLESELFGYEEGAFSGAKKQGKSGLFELAHTGTIFLDEINSLPIKLQGKLLRIIQEKEFGKIGSESIISIDVRIIAAANQDVRKLMHDQKFRTDLFYRLNMLNITMPDLSDRKDDIGNLANHFIDVYSNKYGVNIPHLESRVIEDLVSYNWPGNIRELENTIHRFVLLYNKDQNNNLIQNCFENSPDLSGTNVFHHQRMVSHANDSVYIQKNTLAAMESDIILSYLNEHKWNRQVVADKLGICRSTLWRKIKDIDDSLD